MKQNILLLLFLSLALTGCGSKSGSVSNTESTTDEVQTYINLDLLKEALNKQVVICGEAGLACPSYSAKLAFWGKSDKRGEYFLGVCSGSLYKGKYIITNSHCIPQEIARAGAFCRDQLKVLFPTTKYNNAESAECSKIIQVYNPKLEQPDIAVIELASVVARDSVEIAKDSFIEGANATAYTMNPNADDHTLGTIVKKTCTLSTDNGYFMNTSPSYGGAMISGSSCDIISGNSGSGLINKNGKLIGAIFARMEIPALTKMLEKNNIVFTSKTPMGIVQNITCLNDITTSNGIGCDLGAPDATDFSNFIQRAKEAHGLQAVPDSQVDYELTTSFKLKLKEVSTPAINHDLTSFRDKWFKLFFQNSNTSDAAKILKRFTK